MEPTKAQRKAAALVSRQLPPSPPSCRVATLAPNLLAALLDVD
jgi:hypothetical protein